jgi:protein SCO1/2
VGLLARTFVVILLLGSGAALALPEFDREQALAESQAAIGRTVSDQMFYTTDGRVRRLAEYTGKPLVVSLIFTSCPHICPTTTQHLAKVVRKARKALGDDSFRVVTIGFDAARDTADRMRTFARQQNVAIDGWEFLAADAQTIEVLTRELGFQFYPSGGSFDHLIQSTIIDAKGVIFRQVYGIEFDTPHLIEPLKVLVFGKGSSQSLIDQITARVLLFCTVYDPASDSYKFSYSIVVGLFVGLLIGAIFVVLLAREWRHRRLELERAAIGGGS